MSSVRSRLWRSASPRMIAVSALMHGCGLLAIFALSSSLLEPSPPVKEPPTIVTLVEQPVGPPKLDTFHPGPIDVMEPVAPAEPVRTEPSADHEPAPRKIIEAKALRTKRAQSLPLRKRKRQPQRVVAQDRLPTKKEKAKKREDQQSRVEKRIAAIREQIKNRRASGHGGKASGPRQPGAVGDKATQGASAEAVAQWFEEVRTQVNSHWSVFQDNRSIRGITTIGVKIADTGRLLDATVDKSSGDPMLDRSALRAVFQAAPFPRIPAQLQEKIKKAGGLAFRFTPSGIQ